MIVVTAYHASAALAMARAGLDPRRCNVVNTQRFDGAHQLYGHTLSPDNIRLVPRWQDGEYAPEIEHVFRTRGVDLAEVEYLDL